ncbi:hypothetical protein [Mucilaginibacter sp.]|uniref:hypothetical protein n=1 Tax=Mucilaginibacter sp. TaxID=1882438 RepID=UPI003D0F5CFE
MNKILVILLFGFFNHSNLLAQTTIGESKEEIRKLIQSNPNFKLLPGDNCDTLNFAQGMQAIFLYKNNICYSSTSVLPLKYKNDIIEKMTTDSYKKINDNTWIDNKKTIQVTVSVDKKKALAM